MSKLILIVSIIACLGTITINAATTNEVHDFRKYSDLGLSALKSKNYDSAYKYLDRSSKLGNKVSQYALSLLYIKGLGVKQDYTKAYLWANVAAEVKEKKWQKLREQIHSALTQEQVVTLKPHVVAYLTKYGANTQEVNCYKRASTGTNRKLIQCTKYLTPGY